MVEKLNVNIKKNDKEKVILNFVCKELGLNIDIQ